MKIKKQEMWVQLLNVGVGDLIVQSYFWVCRTACCLL